jgi:GT2 family glycosyltransferase
MNLRIVTATRGDSPFLSEMLRATARISSEVEHLVVAPAARLEAVRAGRALRAVAESGAGLYAAIEQGLREPGSDWDAFTWINDDDVLNAAGFSILLDALARQPEIGVAYGRVTLMDGRGACMGRLPVARRGAEVRALLAQGIMPLAQPGTVIRRSVWEKLGGFDLSYRSAGDLDFFVRALSAGERFAFVDAEVASFRLHGGQLSKRRAEVEAETARALRPLSAVPYSRGARWRFWLGNARVYFERVRLHGFVSMRTLYDRTE